MKELLEKTYNDTCNLDMKEFITDSFLMNKKRFIVTINPEAYMYAEKNKILKEALLSKDTTLIPDAVSVVYAIKKALNKRVTKYPGIDIFKTILEIGNKYHRTVYLYGAKEEVNKDMENYIVENYKDLKIVGRSNGYEKDIEKIKRNILKLKPDIIAVALGVPRQELFISEIYGKLHKGIMIGVGGSFDVIAGHVKRAPKIFIKLNLEWLYRILKEPKRINRFYNNNIKFVIKVKRLKKR